jgi:hypothetical protein
VTLAAINRMALTAGFSVMRTRVQRRNPDSFLEDLMEPVARQPGEGLSGRCDRGQTGVMSTPATSSSFHMAASSLNT